MMAAAERFFAVVTGVICSRPPERDSSPPLKPLPLLPPLLLLLLPPPLPLLQVASYL
jgi:hypothetical protein